MIPRYNEDLGPAQIYHHNAPSFLFAFAISSIAYNQPCCLIDSMHIILLDDNSHSCMHLQPFLPSPWLDSRIYSVQLLLLGFV